MPIRPASPEDIPSLMALERQAATAAHWSPGQYDQALGSSDPQRLVLVIGDEQPQGFLVARSVGAEWEIENVVVTEPARRRGLGGQLLTALLERVRSQGGRAVFLEVRESNWPARALYEKWGFVVSRRRARYYREPDEDAINYRLSFA